MKVAIDISPLDNGHKVRGVGFYLRNLKEALYKSEKDNSFQYFGSVSEVSEADIVHFPYFDPFSRVIPFNLPLSTVVTIHDLIPIKFAKHFPVGLRGNLNWRINKFQMKKLAAIITDSISSKRDIVKYLSYPANKIHVVYLAADKKFNPHKLSQDRVKELSGKYNLPEKFVLYVGDVTWNKNLPRLVEACINKNVPLVMVGKALSERDYDHSHPWNKDLVEVQKLISSSKNIQSIGFVEDNDLVDLYSFATVFVMPSLYEGFGLPIIEAMQSGTPVVTSKEGSLVEVGGEAVKYVDAYDMEDMGQGIAEVFNSQSLQEGLCKKGLEQAKKFSWEKTADQTMSVYDKVVGRRS